MGDFHRFGLLGYPIAHSWSPALHQVLLEQAGLEGEYHLIPTRKGQLRAALSLFVEYGFTGLNVTTPLKLEAKRETQHLGYAEQSGAVNTIWKEGRATLGTQTDVDGVLAPIRGLGRKTVGSVLIYGSGGAARAAIVAGLELGGKVHVVCRHADEKEVSFGALGLDADWHEWDSEEARALAAEADVILNATPLGQVDDSEGAEASLPVPWSKLGAHTLCFDMLYHPYTTPFVAEAELVGAAVVRGWEMLFHQGAASFQVWTKAELDVGAAKSAFERQVRFAWT